MKKKILFVRKTSTTKHISVFTRRQSAYFESWFEMRISNHDSKYGILDRVYAKSRRDSWFEMRNLNTPLDRDHESRRDLAYTRSKIPYFESWFKMRISNYDSKYALCRRVKTV